MQFLHKEAQKANKQKGNGGMVEMLPLVLYSCSVLREGVLLAVRG